MGLKWPFEVQPVSTSANDVDEFEDDNHGKERADDGLTCEVRVNTWDDLSNILQCAATVELRPVEKLADQTLFMILGMSDVRILDDLIYLDYLTSSNHAFDSMASVLHSLAMNSTTPRLGKNLELPIAWKDLDFWRALISSAGDAKHPTETDCFMHYETGQNKPFGYPTKAVHQFDLSLPLHVIMSLLSNSQRDHCEISKPFGVQFLTPIPDRLKKLNSEHSKFCWML